MAIHHYLPQVSLASLVLYYSLLYAYAPRLSHNTPTSNIKLEDFLQEGNPATGGSELELDTKLTKEHECHKNYKRVCQRAKWHYDI